MTGFTWSDERLAPVNGIELAYQVAGDPAARPLLLIMGLGSQMIGWPDGLCAMLAERRFRLIRFDNRDAGHSTWLTDAGVPSLTRVAAGDADGVPYSLDDMAADAAGLLDHLGIERAHVAGASMGGMIGQTLAIRSPERVLSLCSIMSTTGARGVGDATPEATEVLMTRPPADREGYVEFALRSRRVIGSPDLDEEFVREVAGRMHDRGLNPEGTQRQLAAVIASGDRTDDLRRLEVPTVVVHGERDPLIRVSGGRATAEAIPGAELVLVPGMGHDQPASAWERIAGAIEANARRAGAEAGVQSAS
jgi:pimeloyl-ACP methyl ester carboxylesterase